MHRVKFGKLITFARVKQPTFYGVARRFLHVPVATRTQHRETG